MKSTYDRIESRRRTGHGYTLWQDGRKIATYGRFATAQKIARTLSRGGLEVQIMVNFNNGTMAEFYNGDNS